MALNPYSILLERILFGDYLPGVALVEQEIAKESVAAEKDPKEGLRLFIQAMFGANNFLYSY